MNTLTSVLLRLGPRGNVRLGPRRTAIATMLIGTLLFAGSVRSTSAAPSVNGLIAFQGSKDGTMQIYTVAPDGSKLTRLTTGGSSFGPKWSPDGSQIAYTDPGGRLSVMDADGSNSHAVTKGSGAAPTWSPNGQLIAFQSRRDGNPELYMTRTDGSGAELRLTDSPWEDLAPAWSPDGTAIAFSSDRSGILQIYLMTTTNDHTVTLVSRSTVIQYDPTWSPDGTRIAFMSTPLSGEGMGIYVVNRTGGAIQQLTDTVNSSAHEPAWSPDGTAICYSGRTQGQALTIMNSDGSNPRVVNTQGITPLVPDWQPLRPPSVTLHPPVVGATTVFVDGAATTAGDKLAITKVSWDWGDGSRSDGEFPQAHQYAGPGQYWVQITVHQSDGLTNTASVSIRILVLPYRAMSPAISRGAQ